MSTDTATYVGCRVQWHGGDLYVPVDQCRPGTHPIHEATEIAPGVWEIADGVRVTAGDQGQVTEFLGHAQGEPVYRIEWDSGAAVELPLPQPHVIEVAA